MPSMPSLLLWALIGQSLRMLQDDILMTKMVAALNKACLKICLESDVVFQLFYYDCESRLNFSLVLIVLSNTESYVSEITL